MKKPFSQSSCCSEHQPQPPVLKLLPDEPVASAKSCCGGEEKGHEDEAVHELHHDVGEKGHCCGGGDVKPPSGAKYFCPMCPGVESDKPDDCPVCGMALERNPAWKPAKAKATYTCPMHPEVVRDEPGDCPICGMALERTVVAAEDDDEEDGELRDMTRRFWVSAVLTLPVFITAMVHLIPAWGAAWADSSWVRWGQALLSAPVVLWAGAPFFRRGWRSFLSMNLNMWTLISLGVGAAFVFSWVALIWPGVFPVIGVDK